MRQRQKAHLDLYRILLLMRRNSFDSSLFWNFDSAAVLWIVADLQQYPVDGIKLDKNLVDDFYMPMPEQEAWERLMEGKPLA